MDEKSLFKLLDQTSQASFSKWSLIMHHIFKIQMLKLKQYMNEKKIPMEMTKRHLYSTMEIQKGQ